MIKNSIIIKYSLINLLSVYLNKALQQDSETKRVAKHANADCNINTETRLLQYNIFFVTQTRKIQSKE